MTTTSDAVTGAESVSLFDAQVGGAWRPHIPQTALRYRLMDDVERVYELRPVRQDASRSREHLAGNLW
jgi:hypothetical protein